MKTHLMAIMLLSLLSCAAPIYQVTTSPGFDITQPITVLPQGNDRLQLVSTIERHLFNNGFNVVSQITSLDKKVGEQNISYGSGSITNKTYRYEGREVHTDYVFSFTYLPSSESFYVEPNKVIVVLKASIISMKTGNIIANAYFEQSSSGSIKYEDSIAEIIRQLKSKV